MAQTKTAQKWSHALVELHDAFTDFMLSHQAMNCPPATLKFYADTAGVFLAWAEAQNATQPAEATVRLVRQYLAGLESKADRTRHAHVRAIRTLLRFWHAEKYIPEVVKFEMPKIARKRLPRLTAGELQQIVKARNVRAKAIMLFMADTEALSQTKDGTCQLGTGSRQVYRRLLQVTGIHVRPHAMRRTWALLALRAGMEAVPLQMLGGWAGLDMVAHDASLKDADLLQARRDHSPIDNL